jgi:hypothetical protein
MRRSYWTLNFAVKPNKILFFFSGGCFFSTRTEGFPIMENSLTLDSVFANGNIFCTYQAF